jgi:hypothetical protein
VSASGTRARASTIVHRWPNGAPSRATPSDILALGLHVPEFENRDREHIRISV